jgi:putative transposase
MNGNGTGYTASDIAQTLMVHRTSVIRRAEKEKWPYENGSNRMKRYLLVGLPPEVQTAMVTTLPHVPADLIPSLAPEAALYAAARLNGMEEFSFAPAVPSNGGNGKHHGQMPATNMASKSLSVPPFNKGIATSMPDWSPETAVGPDVIRDPRVGRLVRIVQEAQRVPLTWAHGKRKWVEAVAVKHDTTPSSVYRWLNDYEKKGLAGLKHTKSTRKQPKIWDDEAMDWWIGLCLKKEHRRVDKKQLYNILIEEASKRGWSVGSYSSALWWHKRKVSPQLLALQRGGVRALDNTLPPILRDYSDLQPFQILVGDQHKFDFWVVDEETGLVFRPEGYFWQDLRTRCFYGGAIDTKYDAYLMGMALRMGLRIFGAFDQIYTDWGMPERSRYIMGILRDMRAVGLEIGKETEIPTDQDLEDGETINPWVLLPGTHRKAIVRNAKAKMMEGSFNVIEQIMESHFRVPGHVHDLGGMKEENEVDDDEIQRLAKAGKLLTFYEFASTMFRAMDYYNKDKHHRGVLREWSWKPKPKTAAPLDCLRACYDAGWKPVRLSTQVVDVIFLPRASRTVDRGRITLHNERYEHDSLMDIPAGERLEVRYDPMDPEWISVFRGREFLCVASRVEYSSMRDRDLASRKIEEKGRRRKGFILEYRRLTSSVPDFIEYSQVPVLEKAAATMSKEQRSRARALAQLTRPMSEEELAAEVARIEAEAERIEKHDPARIRPVFRTEVQRYEWCLTCLGAGTGLEDADQGFVCQFEETMSAETREYWDLYKSTLNLTEKGAAA